MTSGYRGNGVGGAIVSGQQIQPGSLIYSHLSTALQDSLSGERNLVVNGNFDVWQRGNGNFTAQGMTADRWFLALTAPNTVTASRDTQLDHNALRIAWANGGGAGATGFWTNLEFLGAYSGRAVTLSFEAKADAACSLGSYFDYVYGTGGSSADVLQQIAILNLTTSYQRFYRTISVPSFASKIITADNYFRIAFGLDNASVMGLPRQASGAINIRRVKLEAGAIATPFVPRFFQNELMLCQRYYEARVWVLTMPGNNSNYYTLPFYVQKRVTPTIVISGGTSLAVGGAANDCAFVTYGGASNTNNTFSILANADL